MIHLLHDSDDDDSLAAGEVNSLGPSDGGRIWVGTGTALCRLDRVTGTFERVVFEVPTTLTFAQVSVTAVLEKPPTRSGWVGPHGRLPARPPTGENRDFLTDPRDPITLSDNETLTMPWTTPA